MSYESVPYSIIDAFTPEPFRGNPAAVCFLESDRSDTWMQSIATEFNLSETAFVRKTGETYSLRWFTPAYEVDLCGHATLASAHAIWQTGADYDDLIRFETRSGTLTVTRAEDSRMTMNFPAVVAEAATPPEGLIDALGVATTFVGNNQMDYLVEVATAAEVRACSPKFRQLRDVKTRGVIVTARDDSGDYDFISRFFAPAAGVDEDPVTGSAHCCLGPYWAKQLGRTDLRGYQASKRGGEVSVSVQGDRCLLSGNAVTVASGKLLV